MCSITFNTSLIKFFGEKTKYFERELRHCITFVMQWHEQLLAQVSVMIFL